MKRLKPARRLPRSPLQMFFILVTALWSSCAFTELPETTDVSSCENCAQFPQQWLIVDPKTLIDFDAIEPSRHMDFLLGDWLIYFPSGNPGEQNYLSSTDIAAHETFKSFGGSNVIEAFQYYGAEDNPGFIARSDYRYLAQENRWLWTWLTKTSHAVMTGAKVSKGMVRFTEFNTTGDSTNINLQPSSIQSSYLFRNITDTQFIQEEWRHSENGEQLIWRALYKKVSSPQQ